MDTKFRTLTALELDAAGGGVFFALLLKPSPLGDATPRWADSDRNDDFDRLQQYKESFNGEREAASPYGTPEGSDGLYAPSPYDYGGF
jgi:hypothetical protein